MLGAATKRSLCCPASASNTAQRIPPACSSSSRTRASRISSSGAPPAMRSSTRRWLLSRAARRRPPDAPRGLLVLPMFTSSAPLRSSLSGDEPHPNRFRAACGVPVTGVGGDNRPDHQHLPLPCEPIDITHAGIGSQPLDERTNVADVAYRRAPYRVTKLVVLEKHPDKRTGLKVLTAEPLVEHIEDRQQLLPRRPVAALGLVLQPGVRPELFPAPQESQDECVLGGILFVQGHFRDARSRRDSVDPDCADPVAGKELVGGALDALPRTRAVP